MFGDRIEQVGLARPDRDLVAAEQLQAQFEAGTGRRHAAQIDGRTARRSTRAALVALACIAAAPAPVLTIEGMQPSPISIGLDGLPRGRLDLVAHGKTIPCEGVWLRDVLARAGLPAGDAVKGAALATVVVAGSRDGYRVAFTLGELDAKLGNARVLVADRCNGQVLDSDEGPLRLVVGDAARAARSARQLERLSVVRP